MIKEIIILFYNWFAGLTKSDWILFITFVAIVWYSIETHFLRKWQKKQVQVSIFNIEIERFMNHPKLGGLSGRIPIILKKIYKLGRLDFNDLYVDRTPFTIKERLGSWLKKFNRIKNKIKNN